MRQILNVTAISTITLALALCCVSTVQARAMALDIIQMTGAMIDNSFIERKDSLRRSFDRALADASLRADYIADLENFYLSIYLKPQPYTNEVKITATAWKMNESAFLAAIAFEWGQTVGTYYSVRFFKFYNAPIPAMEEIHLSEALPVLTDADFCRPYVESEICLTPAHIAYRLPRHGTSIEAYISDLDELGEEMFPAETSCYERLKERKNIALHWNGEKFVKAGAGGEAR